MPSPWLIIGWVVVAALAAAVALVCLVLVIAIGRAVLHGAAVVSDTRRWDTERPIRSAWQRIDGDTASVILARGSARIDTGVAVHIVSADRVGEWLRKSNYRRTS